jgi:hypothetical protein
MREQKLNEQKNYRNILDKQSEERRIELKKIRDNYYSVDKNQLMMPGYKHPNLPKPLEQYVLSNSLSFSGHLNNNYFNNQRITYLGDSNLKHNPITCPIDDLEYNKKIAELQLKEKRDQLFYNDERNLNHFQDEYRKQNEKERTIQSKEIKNDYYDWDKNNSIMSRYKTPNIQKPLEQYLVNNNNYAKTPNPNNFIINKKINYLGESTLRHNPITCPIDDLEYNKYIINDLNKYLYDSKDKIGNNSNLDSAGDYNSFGGNYNSNNNRFASNGNMIINN